MYNLIEALPYSICNEKYAHQYILCFTFLKPLIFQSPVFGLIHNNIIMYIIAKFEAFFSIYHTRISAANKNPCPPYFPTITTTSQATRRPLVRTAKPR